MFKLVRESFNDLQRNTGFLIEVARNLKDVAICIESSASFVWPRELRSLYPSAKLRPFHPMS